MMIYEVEMNINAKFKKEKFEQYKKNNGKK